MTAPKLIAAVVGIVCSLELIVAIAIGGAGLGAVFDWNGLIVATAALIVAAGFIVRKRTKSQLADDAQGRRSQGA